MSKLLLFVFTTFFSSFASAENAKLNNVIEEQKMYCKSAVLNGEFKGEKIVGFDLSKEDYFVVSEEATEELVISKNGQKALFFYPHETTCAGKSMNDFCGSSGCSYSFIINEKSYDAHGFGPGVCQRCCPPISCGVSVLRDADFIFRVEPDGSGGLPVSDFA